MFVIFDLFGVILSSGFASSGQKLAALLDVEVETLAPVYRKWEIPFDLGEIDAATFWKNINSELKRDVDWQLLNNVALESYYILPGSFELLKKCEEFGELVLVSNTRQEWYTYLNRKFKFSRFFSKIYLSFDMKMRKPANKIYELLKDDLDFDGSNFVYLDDEAPNNDAASTAGILSIHFKNAFQALPSITKHLGIHKNIYDKEYSGVLLVSKDGNLILQRRDNKAGISNPGKITTFGGTKKTGESFIEAAIREIEEELDYGLKRSQLKPLVSLAKPYSKNQWEYCTFYVFTGVRVEDLTLREGDKIEVLSSREALSSNDLSPICRAVIGNYLDHSDQ